MTFREFVQSLPYPEKKELDPAAIAAAAESLGFGIIEPGRLYNSRGGIAPAVEAGVVVRLYPGRTSSQYPIVKTWLGEVRSKKPVTVPDEGVLIQLGVSWFGRVDGGEYVFSPHIDSMMYAIKDEQKLKLKAAIEAAADLRPIRHKLPEAAIEMPIPPWVFPASDDQWATVASETMFISEAKEALAAFNADCAKVIG